MQTTANKAAIARARSLAALADPARNSNENERATALAKLIAHCAKHGLTVADYLPNAAASPNSGEQPKAEQPKAETAKPEQPKRDETAERAAANRAATMRHYAGPSQASHATRAPALAAALARVATPVQRAKSASQRDLSGLALAETLADANGTFCPVAGTFDLGVLSRLASLGYLTVSGERIKLSPAARDLARNTLKKAA